VRSVISKECRILIPRWNSQQQFFIGCPSAASQARVNKLRGGIGHDHARGSGFADNSQ